MTDYRQLINSFSGLKVLIVGDVMIDAYLSGTVSRMSPEAPVPVVSVDEEVYRLGGAANVALNLMTLGAEPFICSVIGERKADNFFSLLRKNDFSEKGILVSSERKTTQKTRVIDQGKHLLRVDEEDTHDLSQKEEENLLQLISDIISSYKIDVLILQDYNKGVLTDRVIQETMSLCRSKNIPTAVDPKLKRFLNYKGVTLFKPNLKEIKEGLEIEIDGADVSSVMEGMKRLEEKLNNKISFVTLSENGVAIKSEDQFQHIPAHERNIIDVSGAGDTVISVASLCLAKNAEITDIAQLSNLAGGLVCEKVGVVPIDKLELISAAESQINVS